MVEFTFNKITDEDVENFVKDSNVFNMTQEEIEKDKVQLSYFEDERLGASQEKLDVAIYSNNKWVILDIDDKIVDYTEIPIGYIVGGKDYSRVLIIIRRMSNMVLDRVKESVSSYIYCKIGKDFNDISNDKALFGLLAKSHIYLDGTRDEVREQIKTNIIERDEEIYSRLVEV